MDYCGFRGNPGLDTPNPLLLQRFRRNSRSAKTIVSLFATVYYDTQHNEDSIAKKIPRGNRFEGCLAWREVPLRVSGKAMRV